MRKFFITFLLMCSFTLLFSLPVMAADGGSARSFSLYVPANSTITVSYLLSNQRSVSNLSGTNYISVSCPIPTASVSSSVTLNSFVADVNSCTAMGLSNGSDVGVSSNTFRFLVPSGLSDTDIYISYLCTAVISNTSSTARTVTLSISISSPTVSQSTNSAYVHYSKGLVSDVTSVKSDVTSVKSDVSTVKSQVNTIKSTTDSILNDTTFIKSQLDSLGSKVDTTNSKLTESNQHLSSVSNSLQHSNTSVLDQSTDNFMYSSNSVSYAEDDLVSEGTYNISRANIYDSSFLSQIAPALSLAGSILTAFFQRSGGPTYYFAVLLTIALALKFAGFLSGAWRFKDA